ncbi:MAG TPA: c-type cytochrome [Gammaproteobacteria bacterium]|nr:c-type cytochrome [Gammaproteobacteria bacterium]
MANKPMHARHARSAAFFLLMFSAFTCMADKGEQLYVDNCAICHGHQGQGGVGIPLGLEAFLAQTPDEYIRRTIRVGRPGRIMPSFYRLSNQDIDAIITHIRSWRDIRAPAWNASPIKADSVKGKVLFDAHCVSCHGKDARGGKGTGLMFSRPRDLPISPPSLNNQGFLNSVSDVMLKTIITHGRQKTPMPAASQFGLSEGDVNNLVSYIRSFQKTMMTGEQIIEEPAVIMYTSSYSFDKTLENIERAVVNNKFKLIEFSAEDKGTATNNTTEARVYFCNYDLINDALAIDPRIGMFLPCQITVVNYNGVVQAMSINPKRLSQLFNNDELDEACQVMHDTYSKILKEATQ